MENTHNYLQVLSESLDKKIVILNELSELTEAQKHIVDSTTFDEEEFNKNVEKKSGLITELQKLDKGFQLLYNNVKDQLQDRKDMYAAEIEGLQSKIKLILDKNASLQVAEARNKELIEKKFASLKKEVRQVKKTRAMAANYYKSMNNITDEPHFLDKKN